MASRYKLAAGSQVREEAFGLLFYTQSGPRLYFLSAGDLLPCSFFDSQMSLDQWLTVNHPTVSLAAPKVRSLEKALTDLSGKGVLIEF